MPRPDSCQLTHLSLLNTVPQCLQIIRVIGALVGAKAPRRRNEERVPWRARLRFFFEEFS